MIQISEATLEMNDRIMELASNYLMPTASFLIIDALRWDDALWRTRKLDNGGFEISFVE